MKHHKYIRPPPPAVSLSRTRPSRPLPFTLIPLSYIKFAIFPPRFKVRAWRPWWRATSKLCCWLNRDHRGCFRVSISVSIIKLELTALRKWIIKALQPHSNPSYILVFFSSTNESTGGELRAAAVTAPRANGSYHKPCHDRLDCGWCAFQVERQSPL